jgi:hypothetical protein
MQVYNLSARHEDAKSANFMKGSRDTCGRSTMYVFNDFLKFYYSLLHADVLWSELE